MLAERLFGCIAVADLLSYLSNPRVVMPWMASSYMQWTVGSLIRVGNAVQVGPLFSHWPRYFLRASVDSVPVPARGLHYGPVLAGEDSVRVFTVVFRGSQQNKYMLRMKGEWSDALRIELSYLAGKHLFKEKICRIRNP